MKNERGNRQNKPFFVFFLHPVLQALCCWTCDKRTAQGFTFPRSLSLLVISGWIECSALPVHTHTTKYDLHSHFTDETAAHEENRHRRRRFLSVPPDWRVVMLALLPVTVSPRYYLASQAYLYPLLAYTEIPQVITSLLLKSRCTGKSLYTDARIFPRLWSA